MIKTLILILGPQGSGKTTQGKLLADKLNYKFISTGELIRNSSIDSIPAEEWEKMKKGDLVPDSIVEDLLFPILKENLKGFVLDGYPRSMDQIKNLVSFITEENISLSKVFYISLSNEEAQKRIKLRSQIEHRPDEDFMTLKHRLDLYHTKTEPLLTEYKKMDILVKIDGENSVEEVQAQILANL